MPRLARGQSKTITRIYHVLIRGINKQDIFVDNQDRRKFLRELKISKQKYGYLFYAYVLMSNHVHLVICDKNDKISELIHKICTRYAIYFNKKYDRVGHVFQNRFKSICVDTEEYLKNLVRYIHKNPQKAGICLASKYNWSSYKEYIYKNNIIDVEFVLNLFSNNREKAIKEFISFNDMVENRYSDAELEMEKDMTDEEAIDCIERILNIDVGLIKKYGTKLRNEYIVDILKIKGISVKQTARLLGISENAIYKIISRNKK